MAELSAKQRHNLPAKKFGLPKEEGYPMPDRHHAANAKARAAGQYHKGNLSKDQLDKINAKADKILYGKKK